jgi:hypothetical protein
MPNIPNLNRWRLPDRKRVISRNVVCGALILQKRQNTAALQSVAAVANAHLPLAFWSAAVIRRFSTK